LRLGIAFLRSLANPFHRLGIIPRNAFTVVIHQAKIELRHGITLLGLGAGFGKRRVIRKTRRKGQSQPCGGGKYNECGFHPDEVSTVLLRQQKLSSAVPLYFLANGFVGIAALITDQNRKIMVLTERQATVAIFGTGCNIAIGKTLNILAAVQP
jgi:hypothetical protein